jgi:hypothetical protein
MRSSFHRSLSLAAVALASGVAFAGTPLPNPPFSFGGFVPPDSAVYRQEYYVSKTIEKYAAKSGQCDYKAVLGLQLAYEPNNATKIAELQAAWQACRAKVAARYVYERDRLLLKGTPACLNQTGIDAIRDQVDLVFGPLQAFVFCDGDAAAPDPVTLLNIPDFKNEANGETDVAKLVIKLGRGSWKCFLKAVVTARKFGGTIPPEYLTRIDACFDKLELKGIDTVADFDQQQKLPDCISLEDAQNLVTTTIALSGQFTGDIFCASPSGAFLD